jgi:hypothetical protein
MENNQLNSPEISFSKQNKDSHLRRVKQTILNLLLSGKILTSRQGNTLAKTSDFRKAVSVLRREGWPITDKWVYTNEGQYKEYWLKEKDPQLSLPLFTSVNTPEND